MLSLSFSAHANAQTPAIHDFYAVNMSLVKGESTPIYWYSQDAAYARVYGFGKELNPLERRLNGGMMVAPTFSTTYELKLFNQRNEQVAYRMFTIIVTDSEPVVEVKKFHLDAVQKVPGQAMRFEYEVTGFKELSITDTVTGQTYNHLNFCCSIDVYPTVSTVFALRIIDRQGQLTQYYQSVDVYLPPPPARIDYFSASQTDIFAGASVTLSWKAAGSWQAVSLIDRTTGRVYNQLAGEGQLTVAPSVPTVYALQIQGSDGQILSSELLVRVTPAPMPPSIDQFQSSRTEINAGESISLFWKSHGSIASVKILDKTSGQIYSGLPTEGQLAVTPTRSTLYTLQLVGTNGQVTTFDILIQVNDPRPASIEYFVASTLEVNPGEPVTLYWKTQAAMDAALLVDQNAATADFSIPFGTGSVQVYPAKTSLYTLKVLSPNGQIVEASLSIRVRPVAPEATPQAPQPQDVPAAVCSALVSASAAASSRGSGASASASVVANCGRSFASSSASASAVGGFASASASSSSWIRW